MSSPSTRDAIMSGHGFYNRHSVLQAAAAERGLAALRAAAIDASLEDDERHWIADYGCSQGQNSLIPMGVAVTALRERGAGSLTVVHTDLPDNDFSAVFEVLAVDPASYLRSHADTYALVAGRSFYEQVVAPDSVSLGWSSITTHWLSRVPMDLSNHVAAQSSDDDGVRRAFSVQAAQDWAAFLDARAAELSPGGRLVMVEPCAHPEGTLGSEPMLDLMDQVLVELVGSGRVGADAAAAATLPMWLRTPEEYAAPVDDHPYLELRDLQVLEAIPSPLWTQYERDGDAAAYASASVASMRAWSESMLAAGIPDPAVLDEFYDRCRQLGTADPQRLHLQAFHVVMDIGRSTSWRSMLQSPR
ncbi:MAG: hypothetical protein ACK4V6_11135 [Microthrixaceae bacterium]